MVKTILSSAEAEEIVRDLGEVSRALELLPYRTAAEPIARLSDIAIRLRDVSPEEAEAGDVDKPDEAARAAVEGEGWVPWGEPKAGRKLDLLAMGRDIAEGWVPWGGGRCPLHPETVVDVRLRSGETMQGSAQWFNWKFNHDDVAPHNEIIAYRPVSARAAAVYENDPPAPDTDGPVAVDLAGKREHISPAEIQLLRQLMRGPITTFHSATIAAATRLRGDDLAMTYELPQPLAWGVEITAKGKRRLIEAGLIDADIEAGKLADALAAITPYETVSGQELVAVLMAPDRRDFLVAALRAKEAAK